MIDNLSNRELWNRLYHRFDDETCGNCCKDLLSFRDMSNPQPIPYVGPDFYQNDYRLMFVGIETYCNWPPRKSSNVAIYDKFCAVDIRRLFLNIEPDQSGVLHSPFWDWMRIISEHVLQKKGDEAFNCIAYSNLHKCQSRKKGSTKDDFCKSNYEIIEKLSRNCIQKSGWVYREINEIKPKNV